MKEILWDLVIWVQTHDKDFKGRTRQEIFFAAYGDKGTALANFKLAKITDDDIFVRAFCLERREKAQRT